MSSIADGFISTIHIVTQAAGGLVSPVWAILCDAWMEALIVAVALHVYFYLSPKVSRTDTLKTQKSCGDCVPSEVPDSCATTTRRLEGLKAVCNKGDGADFRRLLANLLQKGNVHGKCAPEALDRYEDFIRSQGGRQHADLSHYIADAQSARTIYTSLIVCGMHAVRAPPGSRSGRRSNARAWISHLLADMRLFGFARSQDFYATVLRALTNGNFHEDAMWLHDEVIADGVEPDRSMYICLLNVSVSLDHSDNSLFFFKQLEKLGAPSMRSYMTVFRIFSKRQDWTGASELLNGMQAAGVLPDALVLNTVLGLCVSSGQVRVAGELLQKFAQQADVISYNIILKGHAQHGSIAVAETLLKKMLADGPTPNLISFNTVMDCAVRAMQAFSAASKQDPRSAKCVSADSNQHEILSIARRPWEILEQLTALGLQPDRYTCSTLVKGMHLAGCSVDDIDKATALLRRIGPVALQQATSAQGNSPASGSCNARLLEVLFNTLLDACVNARDLDRMGAIFQMMEEYGVGVSAVTFGTLIKAFGQAGHSRHCHEVWQRMQDANIAPTIVTFGCYIDACIRCEELDTAEAIFMSMPKKGVQPNGVIFTSLIRGFAHARQPLKALEIYRSMRERGIEATAVTFNSVLDIIARQLSSPEKLEEVLSDMEKANIPPDVVTYSILIKASCNAGNLRGALSLLRQISCHGLAVDEVAFNTLLLACSKAEQVEDAEEIFSEMCSLGMKPTHVTASILVKMYGKAKMLDKAIATSNTLEREFGLKPNLFVFTCLIQACVQNKQVRRSWDVFNKMLQDGITPDAVTYGTVVHGCIYQNKFEEAMQIVRHAYAMPAARCGRFEEASPQTPFVLQVCKLERAIGLQPEVLRTLRSALRRKEQNGLAAELESIAADATSGGSLKPSTRQRS